MALVNMVQGNTAPSLPFTIKRAGTLVDLTGCTVKFKIHDNNTGIRTNDAANTCALGVPNTGGTCTYSFSATDLPDATSYSCDLEITYPNATVETAFEIVLINARAKA
jgi:hypothetical protein